MGWRIPWVSAKPTSTTTWSPPTPRSRSPGGAGPRQPAADRSVNAAATGTDINGYLSEAPAVSVFTRQDGTVYQTYAVQARGWSSS